MIGSLLNLYVRLAARPALWRMNSALHTVALRGLGILNFHARQSGEDWFLENHLATGDGVVFDVGANTGGYTSKALTVNPHLKIIAFEPHPTTFKRLVNSLGDQPGVTLVNKALSSRPGTMTLYDYAADDGSEHASLYPEVITQLHGARDCARHEVDVLTVDDFVTINGISDIRLLKIDAEGNEFNVLLGARQTLADKRIKMIHFEFNEMNVASRRFFKDFWDLLPDYTFYRLLPRGLAAIKRYNPLKCEVFAYQNIVAIHRPTP
jgi:FkbM family methyltransferase